MTQLVRKLTPDEFHRRAESSLDRVFKSLDFKNRPFQDKVKERMLIDVAGFWLDEKQFEALCRAASAAGDSTLLYSIIRGYSGGPEHIAFYSWELSLLNYESYCDAENEPPNKDHDIGIPLDRVLYSPSGTWGVLLPDLFALVGGSSRFIGHFKEGYPRWSDDVASFVSRFEEARVERGTDVSWVPELLRHIYGSRTPQFPP